jgi:hypothetical protein
MAKQTQNRNSASDDEALADIGFRPQVNQVQDEPMPDSEHDDQRQEANVQSEQLGVSDREHDHGTGPLYEADGADRGEDRKR